MSEDELLRQAFQASRTAERRAAPPPPFGRVLSREPSRRRSGYAPLGWLLTGSLAALAVWLVQTARARSSELELARQVLSWRAPTDFLLPPTAEALVGVPDLRRAVAGSPLAALDPGGSLGPPATSRSPQ